MKLLMAQFQGNNQTRASHKNIRLMARQTSKQLHLQTYQPIHLQKYEGSKRRLKHTIQFRQSHKITTIQTSSADQPRRRFLRSASGESVDKIEVINSKDENKLEAKQGQPDLENKRQLDLSSRLWLDSNSLIQCQFALREAKKINKQLKRSNESLRKQLSKLQNQAVLDSQHIKALQTQIYDITHSKPLNQRQIQPIGSPWQKHPPCANVGQNEDIEGLFRDLDRNFDEMMSISKIPSEEGQNPQMEEIKVYKQTITALRERVNYLELEVSVLKKFKFEVGEAKTKCERLKFQVKMLSNKLLALSRSGNFGKKREEENDLDYTISFSLVGDKGEAHKEKRK